MAAIMAAVMAPAEQREVRIQVLGKVSSVLDLLLDEPRELRLVDVERRLGLSRSTAFRLLASMEHEGWVDRDAATGGYRLGLRLLQLGMAVSRRLDLRDVAAPVLAELTAATRQTSFLSIRRHFEAVCIDRVPGSHVDVLALTLGGALPLHVGAAPRVLLAAMSDAEIAEYLGTERLAAVTPRSIASREALLADVERTRSEGYAFSDEDVSPGVCALGAPVIDGDHRVVAALSISDVAPSYGNGALPELVERVRTAAAAISARLGSPSAAVPAG
jgi:DNA-binding IclR family transcriptional regulator